MIGTQYALLIGVQRLKQPQGLVCIAAFAGPGSDVGASLERIRMIDAKRLLPIGKKRPEEVQRCRHIPTLSGEPRDMSSRSERI